ncbi:MAG: LytR/AlgR family response regulator transcription factor [Gammaproteobacteria bacterium]
MKIIIVDDEPLARSRLRRLLRELDATDIVGEGGTGVDAIELARETGADLVLLDIRMPSMDGIEAARHLAKFASPPAVVFTTAYDQHALDAFNASALDYLLKPIRKERLGTALERARQLTQAQAAQLAASELDRDSMRTHISAMLNGNLYLLPLDEVRFFRADQKYVAVRHVRGEVVIEESLAALEEEFGDRFLRVHRNALVASAWVRELRRGRDGRYHVQLDGVDEGVEVSRRMVSSVKQALKSGRAG